MLFNIHSEGKISFKRLSKADLKRGKTSHQTHIGLSNDSLTFMQDNKKEYSAMLIYDAYCDIVKCEVGKIRRRNGTYDAPNIKSIGRTDDSVVKQIRSFASDKITKDFYLLWFGLESGTPVFWLIAEDSLDYINLNQYCEFNELGDRNIRVLDEESRMFKDILKYAKKRLEDVTLNLQKDLELTAELESDNPKFKDEDVKKAKSYIQEIGRKGEEIVNEFLSQQKIEQGIESFEWSNKSSEAGKPYDFWIKYVSGQEKWIDVKTTEYEFERAIIVSKNEINFITNKRNIDYAVFRVYSKSDIQAKMKICSECLRYVKKLQRDIEYMTTSMSDYRASMINYKIAFEPGIHSFNSISSEYIL